MSAESPTPDELAAMDKRTWLIIGMANRMKTLTHKMHEAAVNGQHVTVYANGVWLGALNIDFRKEVQ